MDVFAHALWVTVATKKGNKVLEKEHKKPINFKWAIFWGVFPDLAAFGLPFLALIYYILIGDIGWSSFGHWRPPTSFQNNTIFSTLHLYPWTHSLIIFAGVFLLIWLIRRKIYWPMLGWGFHILIDIPSHAIGFYPTQFLFPFSKYVFPYGISWSNTYFMIFNYLALLLVYVFYVFKKKKVL